MALFPFGLSADQLVWWGFVATVVAAVFAIWGGVASTFAAKYAKDAPTKEDFKRLEKHAADTSGHLQKQADKEELDAAASVVSIVVEGRDFQDEPLQVHLRLKDPSVRLNYIEMLNTAGTRYGGSPCVMQGEPDHYVAELDPRQIVNWFNAGDHFGNTAHVWLRVAIGFDDKPGQGRKRMPVVLLPTQVGTERKTGPVWQLSGEV